MPSPPIQQLIFEALRERLRTITVEGGFHTNAGQQVRLGRVIDPESDELPGIFVALKDPSPVTNGSEPTRLVRSMTLVVEGIVRVTDEDPFIETTRVVDDIKRAVFRPDDLVLTPGALGLELVDDDHFPAEPGSNYASGHVTFNVRFTESLGE